MLWWCLASFVVYLTYPVSSLLGSIIGVNPDGISCPSSGHLSPMHKDMHCNELSRFAGYQA